METQKYYSELRDLAISEGMAVFGVADVKAVRNDFILPDDVKNIFTAGISYGFHLSEAVLKTIQGAPNQIYYFHYQRVNQLMDQVALKLTSYIQERGYQALPIPSSQVIDWTRQLGSVSHREIARLAGLGWYGRNNLLVNPRFGSQVRYCTVLTDMPLTADKPINEDVSERNACGECYACEATCPAGAITEDGFNREACHAKLKDFMKTEHIGQMICGVCVNVCKGRTL
jgi:epoxyqueuosine reductase QueG